MTGLALFELCAVLALVLGFGVVFPYFMDDMRYESPLAERAGAVVTVPGGLK